MTYVPPAVSLPRAAPRRALVPALVIVAGGALAALAVSHGEVFAHALERAVRADWALVVVGALLEAASLCGYIVLLHRVVSSASDRLGWRDSYDITLAGTVATRLLPTAGLGGAAVTVWALRSHGVKKHEVAERILAFLLLLYSVYMAALVVCGSAVALGLVHVSHGRVLGAVGAALGAGVTAAVILALSAPGFVARIAPARVRPHLEVLPSSLRRAAVELRHPAMLGALASWGFDIAVLWTMLHAFGVTIAPAVLILAYFLGTMFNVVPLPGSLSGGLVGVLVALGTPLGATITAVLAYRAVATWGPAACGLASVGRLRERVRLAAPHVSR